MPMNLPQATRGAPCPSPLFRILVTWGIRLCDHHLHRPTPSAHAGGVPRSSSGWAQAVFEGRRAREDDPPGQATGQ